MKRFLLLGTLSALITFQSAKAQFVITSRIDNFAANGSNIQFDITLWDGGPNYTSGTTLFDDGNIRYDLTVSGGAILNTALGSVTFNTTYLANSSYNPVIGGPAALPPLYRFGVTLSRGTKPDLPTVPTAMIHVTIPYTGTLNSGNTTILQRTNTSTNGSFWSSLASNVSNQAFDPQNQGTPLPINLLSFNATATTERTAKIEWATATEKNSSHFFVERSANGQRFNDVVARMEAAGMSNDLLNYQTYDANPFTGANYYRLKMFSKDGSFKYSETRRVVFDAPLSEVAAIPNPFQSATIIRVNADGDQKANYYVMDATGRVIRSGVWEVAKGVQEFPMPLGDAAAGTYLLTVQGSTLLAELKLVKTN